MDAALERLVWRRGKGACEYCQLPQAVSAIRFEIDHVIPRKHRGRTIAANLALSCFYCNSYKGLIVRHRSRPSLRDYPEHLV